jgi:flagellar biosynthesis/type III secretory pathway chaperone
MDTAPHLATERLSELIAQKLRVLSQLRELAHRQRDTIASGEMSRLLGLLAAKQRMLEALQDVERKLDPFRSQDPESRDWRSEDDRQRARRTAEACESLLREIMQIEQHCESDMRTRRDATAAQLQGTHQAAMASRAYVGLDGPNRQNLDLSSER